MVHQKLENQTNIVTENPKTLKILLCYQFYTNARPINLKTWSESGKMLEEQKAIPIRYTKCSKFSTISFSLSWCYI